MSNTSINLSELTARVVSAVTFAQGVYPRFGGGAFTPPDGFTKVTISVDLFKPTSSGFAAETYVNKATGEVVIAYRGSDTVGEAVGIAARSASTGEWDPQFTDATNYAKQAQLAALADINKYRENLDNPLPPLKLEDLTPLVTGHSLGGLLGQVVSKMFGWPAEVFDSLGGGKLIGSKEYIAQAKAVGQVDASGNPIEHDVSDKITNYAASEASSVGTQLGKTVDIPALGQMGGMGTVASMMAFFINPVAGALVTLTQQQIAQHGKYAIEEAMYGLAALKPLVEGQGNLRVQTMSEAQATGEGSSSTNVLALVNDNNEVVAYITKASGATQFVVQKGSNAGAQIELTREGGQEDGALRIAEKHPGQPEVSLSPSDLLGRLSGSGNGPLSVQKFDDGSRIENFVGSNGVQVSRIYDATGKLIATGSTQTFDDGSQLELKTEGGKTYVRSLVPNEEGGVDRSEWAELKASQPELTPQAYQQLIYSDMAGFLSALRNGDKLNQALYGVKLTLDVMLSQGKTLDQSMASWRNGLEGVSGAVGVAAGLRALRSDDTLTQLNGAVGLLSSSNQLLASLRGGALGKGLEDNGFLTSKGLENLQIVSSVLAIANLRNLDNMLENGQVGSAAMTLYQAYKGAEFIGKMLAVKQNLAALEAGATAVEAGAAATGGASAAGVVAFDPTTLAIMVAVYVLDRMFSEDPPPKPPVGWVEFKRGAQGSGQPITVWHAQMPDGQAYGYGDAEMGQRILNNKMSTLLAGLVKQVSQANQDNAALKTDPDRALVLVASRIPKVHLQSWIVGAGETNGKDNYHFLLESTHAQTGEKTYQPMARQDIDKLFSSSLIAPEALIQRWQANHMQAKFNTAGAVDESKWLTEGQYLSQQSAVEKQRGKLKKAWLDAQKTLDAAKAKTIDMSISDDATAQERADHQVKLATQLAAKNKAIAQAQEVFKTAQAEYVLYNAQHPQDAQLAATEVGVSANSTNANDKALWNNAEALYKARQNATHQWLKVVALDWDGKDDIAKLIPKANLSTDLKAMQTDGAARFDVDNDGYREVTEWVGNKDAVLGLDRDGNGLIDTAAELLNAPNTPFDQRGLNSLKYYDSNNDGKLSAADQVWKYLRIWIDANGDGSAGGMETLTMDMAFVGLNALGLDMAALRAASDEAGKKNIDDLLAKKVMAIDLATQRMTLANNSNVSMVEQSLKAEVLGTMLEVDAQTQNVTVLTERRGAEAAREQYITTLQDLSVLQELKRNNLSAARREYLLGLARKYGLDPNAADFKTTLDNLVAGVDMVVHPATIVGERDVWVDLRRLVLSDLESLGAVSTQSNPSGGVNDGYTKAHTVNDQEVKGDTPEPTVIKLKTESWALPSNVYALDLVTQGAQQGGLTKLQTVVVSETSSQTKLPVPKQVQVYTTAKPSVTLSAARYAGQEDVGLSLGYLQLEQEARGLFAGGKSATLKLLGVREVRHGEVAMDDANGLMRFVPEADYTGKDAGFTYVLVDGTGRVMQRRVDVVLAEVNDAPMVLGESVATTEDVPLVFDALTLLGNDTDKEGDKLEIMGIGRVGMGKVTLEENGQIRYVPPNNLYGVTDSFEYLVQDARGGVSVGVVKVKIASVADAPTVVGEVIRNAHEDQTLYIDAQLLLANDFDPDVDARVGGAPLRITAVADGEHGQVFLDASGHVIFVPETNFNGTARFSYTVADADGLTTQGKAEIVIAAVNDAVQAVGETIESVEDQVLTIAPELLLANDQDADVADKTQELRLSAVGRADLSPVVGGRVALVGGQVVFTPTANYAGEASFSYVVQDGAGGVSSARVKINLAAVNDAPVVPRQSFVVKDGAPLKIRASELMASVSDADDDKASLVLTVDLSSAKGGLLSQAFDAALGEDVYTFTASSDAAALVNGLGGFSYSVADKHGAKTVATAAVDVNSGNDAPVFVPGSKINKHGLEDAPMRIAEQAIVSMFSDPEGEAMEVDVDSLKALLPGDKVDFDKSTREVVFVPEANASGERKIELLVKDASGARSAPVQLALNLDPVGDAPIVRTFGFESAEDGGTTQCSKRNWSSIYFSDILKNASDADADGLKVTWVGNFSAGGNTNAQQVGVAGAWGASSPNQTVYEIDAVHQKLKFMAPLNYMGSFTFDYKVSDTNGNTTTGHALGVIKPVDDAPVVSFQRIDTRPGGAENASWRINVTDVDDAVSGYTYAVSRHSAEAGISGPILGRTTPVVSPVVSLLRHKPVLNLAPKNYFVLDEHQDGGGRDLTALTSVAFTLTSSQKRSYDAPLTYTYYYDPIVIDLGRDGLSFIDARDSKARFDVDGDGVADQMAWAGGDDALLVYDHNNDGQVTRFDELAFGYHLKDPNPDLPDLRALARPEFDTNQDGVFNAKDAKWSQFKLWQDTNSNGVVDVGEMKSLQEAGVSGLYLQANVLNHAYSPDVTIRGFTRVQMSDGRLLQAGDAQFALYDPSLETSTPAPGEDEAGVTTVSTQEVQAQIEEIEQSLDAQLHAGNTHYSGDVSGASAHQKALVGVDYTYELPPGAVYAVTLADGRALPSWLSYDASTHTLQGKPTDVSLGGLTVKVSTLTQAGGTEVSSATFTLEVQAYNQAPEVYGEMPTQFAQEGEAFSLEVAPNFFMDRDATDVLAFSATLVNGDALPSWLHFDAQHLRFEGTPSQGDVGDLEVVLTARDAANATASEHFYVVVSNVNDAPTLEHGLQPFGVRVGESSTYVIASNTFADADMRGGANESLSLTVTMADGSALPAWLSFSSVNATLTATPKANDVVTPVQLRVLATDMYGASVSTLLTVGLGQWGTQGDDSLVGSEASEYLWGESGNDRLSGEEGADVMYGGLGNDVYVADAFDTVIENPNAGVDTVSTDVSYILSANVENLVLTGNAAINGTGNELNNVLTGNSAANVLNGGSGADTMQGGAGDDSYVVDSVSDAVVENANEGTDTVRTGMAYVLGANVENLVLTGSAAIDGTGNGLNNVLTGNSAANVLTGGAGDDTLIGGDGADKLFGGEGDDVYEVDVAGDVVSEDGGAGTDTVQASLSYVLGVNVENLTLTGSAAINGTGNALNNVLTGNSAANVLTGGAGDDVLIGGGGSDTLRGGTGDDVYVLSAVADKVIEIANEGTDTVQTTAGYTLGANVENLTLVGVGAVNGTGNELSNVLTGNSAANVLTGGIGNDSLIGGGGADKLLGGVGDDVYVVDDAAATVTELANEGTDTVKASVTYALSANVEHLVLTGNAAINGTGNELNNVLTGNSAANVLDGGAGADTMQGGAGDDSYVVDSVSDAVVENANEGTDTVRTGIAYVLGANVENLVLTGSAAINGTGNELNNVLTGNSAANVLAGGIGNDTLIGGGGADKLLGGVGDDVYVVDDVAVTVTELANEGTDTVKASMAYVLGANVENLVLTGDAVINGMGNALNNVLTGNSAANVLDGGAGADTMQGGAGDDSYVVDNVSDVVVESANEGADTVRSSVTYALSANVENLVLTGSAAINATGNELSNMLTGNIAANVLTGGAGDDTLAGGGGADKLLGGVGDDVYVVDDAAATVMELANEGTDTVRSSVAYALGANVENLVLTGSAAINGTGNELNNVLTGNSAANVLTGGAGDDTLIGGGGVDKLLGGVGDDVYMVDDAAASVTELTNEGTDTVRSSVTYALSANVENLVLTGFGAVNATGNALNNMLTGNSAANVLTGGAGDDTLAGGGGADTLLGGTGNDTYVVDDAAATVTEFANEGTDTVKASMAYVLGVNLENLVLTGDAAINGTGNELNNVLTGNSAANVLDGGAGADTMQGGAGDDTYVMDHVSDAVFENANEGTDTVKSSVTYALGANVENLVLTGDSAINGTGNELNNVLTGNRAANELVGGAGDDTLAGGGGADKLLGGVGDDVYVVDDAAATVTELANEGTDTVKARVTYTLSANVENLVLTGDAAINGTGNELNNMLMGNSAANVLTGGAGDDTLIGGGGADALIGGEGDDVYVVSDTTTTITENLNAGVDAVQASVSYTLAANVENLTLTGTQAINGIGNDSSNLLTGNASANVLKGGAGDDTLIGLGGADELQGGTGDDVYLVTDADVTIIESVNAGIDIVRSSVTYALSANVENLTLTGAEAINGTGNDLSNLLKGNAGVNVLSGGAGNDTLMSLGGADTLLGGLGSDVYVVDDLEVKIIENESAGLDTVLASVSYALAANVENLTLTGVGSVNGAGNGLDNVLTGNGSANVLDGGAGDDLLIGGGGADTLRGGVGNDVYVVDDSNTTIMEDSKSGFDTVYASVNYTLSANIEQLIFTGSDAANVTGNALNNMLTGNVAANVLDGGAGDDTLAGGGGADKLSGGVGDDVYVVDDAAATVTELANEGTDTVKASVTYALSANVEHLVLTGDAAINGTGNELNNLLTGNSAANVLDGGAGADTMQGGAGDDTYVMDHVSDAVVENANEGTDTVKSSVTYALGANVENLVLTGSAAINGTGNGLNNVLTGNSAANVLTGGAGDDTLAGGGGADTLLGGLGNDTYVVDDAAATVTELANEGADTVKAGVTHELGANLENLVLTGDAAINGTGNTLNNVLTGNSAANKLTGGVGNDTLIGGGGADTLLGGTGNDTYVVGDAAATVTELANEGTDTVKASVTYALSANVEHLVLTGDAAINGTGNELNNVLTGNSAANELDGGAGADTMQGGAGDDTYVMDHVSDAVVENANEGTDTVKSSVTYALGANVENLVLTGDVAINGTGNALNNVLTGNSAANKLTGGAGDDTLAGGGGADALLGGAGNDTYVVDDAAATVTELTNEGTDTVRSSVTYALSANVENLVLTGFGAVNATGNALNNMLTGNSAANVLTGGAGDDTLAGGGGADTLLGGTGNDTYVVDDAAATVTEFANEGTDTVKASMAYVLGVNLENLVLTGDAAINGTGNTLNNMLTGNSAANVLTGGVGNDTLIGGTGADKFVFNAQLNAQTNMDTITDFSKAQGDQIVLDKSIFTMLAGKTDLTNHFRLSKQAAVGGDDYIVYNATTGQLSYDASGSGSSTAVVFATLSNKPQDLTAQQFVVM